LPDAEAFAAFNMGVGFVLIVAPDAVAEVMTRVGDLGGARPALHHIGNVVPGAGVSIV
jgi:phosphoribosylaminoimidazole (AIR) synthetase